jgi:hypothetical protein
MEKVGFNRTFCNIGSSRSTTIWVSLQATPETPMAKRELHISLWNPIYNFIEINRARIGCVVIFNYP